MRPIVIALLPAALISAALLSGCQKDTDPGPGGVTQGEAKALDDAATMLEQRPRPPLSEATVPADLESAPAQDASGAAAN